MALLYFDVTDNHNSKGLFFLVAGLILRSALFCYRESTMALGVSVVSSCCLWSACRLSGPVKVGPLEFLTCANGVVLAFPLLGWLLLTTKKKQ